MSAAADGVTVDEADDPATTGNREDQATYTVALDSEPTGTVSISLASGDTDVATVAPARLTFDGDDWSTAKTVTVTAVDDDLDNTGNARSATIAHTVSAADTDYASETADPVTVTVTDDDAAPTLSIDSPSVTEGDTATDAATAARHHRNLSFEAEEIEDAHVCAPTKRFRAVYARAGSGAVGEGNGCPDTKIRSTTVAVLICKLAGAKDR